MTGAADVWSLRPFQDGVHVTAGDVIHSDHLDVTATFKGMVWAPPEVKLSGMNPDDHHRVMVKLDGDSVPQSYYAWQWDIVGVVSRINGSTLEMWTNG